MKVNPDAMPADHTNFQVIDWNRCARDPGNEFRYPYLQRLVAPHIESFNAVFEPQGKHPSLMSLALKDIPKRAIFDGSAKPFKVTRGAAVKSKDTVENSDGDSADEAPAPPAASKGGARGNKLTVWFEDVTVGYPMVSGTGMAPTRQFPVECRERSSSYRGRMQAKLCWQINDDQVQTEVRSLGAAPVMVRSNRCNLQGLGPAELIRRREESEEFGGYFVVNGNEKIIRMLITTRGNHIQAIQRNSFTKRGGQYSPYGVTIRCVRPDTTSATITMHYLNDGNLTLRFYHQKQEFLVPVMLILSALAEVSDKEIFLAIIQGDFDNTYLTDRVELLLRSYKALELFTRKQALEYLGIKFRVVMNLPEDLTAEEVGRELLRQVVGVHLTEDRDKFNLLVAMIQKLYGVVSGEYAADNGDSAQAHDVLLGGQIYLALIKDRLDDLLINCLDSLRRDMDMGRYQGFTHRPYLTKALNRVSWDIGARLDFFLATGNLVSRSGLDINQTSGFTIIAEKLNFLRFLAHFRCVHRGAFFATMKTTSVRKLLPESWGFMCPVHTPDGSPCGLLTHLSHTCQITTTHPDTSAIPHLLASLGMSQIFHRNVANPASVTVQLDGRVIGYCSPQMAATLARKLRYLKVTGGHNLPLQLEIGYVPMSRGGQYPGLYLFTGPGRMVRPVRYLLDGASDGGPTDLVGSFEQVYMEIACLDEDVVPGTTTHQEFGPTHILSVLASMTPFSDFNQSPRNMYQCQMGKQTMGTPAQALTYRGDNKLYRLQSGQTPIVRTKHHAQFGFDEFPNGTNACVAVISYTGYDMEDAMILNKSAHERGFKYGTVYKTEEIDLAAETQRGQAIHMHFGLGPEYAENEVRQFLDMDGLPYEGTRLRANDPFYAVMDDIKCLTKIFKYKGPEDAVVDKVRLLGSDSGNTELQHVTITLRIPRFPVVGDKFSSRHGQKGVCSQKWPAIDLPFSESGIQPDIIINPHAFPSRMTIGMFVESMAAKAGAVNGLTQDATPFQFSEDFTAADYFGEQLAQSGFNYHGNEPMYSGATGEEFQADIYFGVVYYQRLRHMVNDKFQVRSMGRVNQLTMQPVKGRKRGGGVRFGEMERDSLIAHGVSYLLQDRLLNCSDYTQAHICRLCGSILSPFSRPPLKTGGRHFQGRHTGNSRLEVVCKTCQTSEGIRLVAIPYVFKYLSSELACMNIRMAVKVD
ncbi:hypothetical protein IWQ60_000528 [Tieghemiomyces parasiticus]|uniref:DNA-directed RNA polymerase subunit beta n=1 Tax=Tieghemiomyces parasiticus TaxID=78921 RepID=A0A9W8ALK0_9FUNG|nr:hypothetical protein IWQ60_000528 [Tieghemiomyces parasiticus]